ncbi:MAG: chemotaxis protein CheA [Verrucomicrobiota bacterium]|jgi:two-component system chemotaxis sensor kinase CheA
MNTQLFAELKKLGDKIATELVFAEPGKDLGLLPVNSLLGQIEELVGRETLAGPLVEAAKEARRWINALFESTGMFNLLTLKRLGQWTEWWQTSVAACETQSAPPPIPADWQSAGNTPAETAPAPTKQEELRSQEEPTLTLNLEPDRDLLNEFMNDSQEHLQNIEQGILVLEQNPTDADNLNSIFRAFHTFKGCAGFLNLTAIQTLAHELESLLDLARQHKLSITPAVINLILEGGDTLRQFSNEIAAQLAGKKETAPIVVPTLRLLERIRSALAGKSGANILPVPSVTVSEQLRPEAAAVVSSGNAELPAAQSPPIQAPDNVTPAPNAENGSTARATPAGAVVKVDTLKLDSLVDLVGEMLIAQSLVVQNKDLNTLQNEQLTRDMAHLGRISKDLQHTVMSLRMMPIRSTFQKMNRLVRDLSIKVGKQVNLVTEGEDTELDRTIVEEISDPLVHMIRNSVDHGIEMPEVRLQRGKPAQGTVSLKAFHQGGNIVIEIRDDGNGLDRNRILAKAVEKGLVRPDEEPSDSEVFNLIWSAGFSTAETVTDLSGRGVGMDVVRRNIEKLRGKVEIQSKPGQGSTFSIFLPLTLAIIDGLLVGVGEHRYIVPTLLVRESFRPTADMIHTLHERGEMINLRGRLHPLLRLYAHLGIKPATTDPAESIVVVVEAGAVVRCLLVDKLLGKHEVVIKSLGETFHRNKYLAGAAILGDGRVGLILDPQALGQMQSAPLEAAA